MSTLSRITKQLIVPVLIASLALAGCQAKPAVNNPSANTQSTPAPAQASKKTDFLLLDAAAMNDLKVKYKNGDSSVSPKVTLLKGAAELALKNGPYSVVDKKATPPSGDKHDYMTIGIYWWPDPSKPDGKPYIRKDGYVNPEVNNDTFDKSSYGKMSSAVQSLTLAYFYTDNEAYATHGAKLLRTWFLEPATRMNPNLNYGQAVPGVNDGRAEGIIETVNIPNLIDCAILLNNNSSAFTKEDMDKFKTWVADYLKWLLESPIGKDEDKANNNHGEWYDAQVVAYAIFTGQKDLAVKRINEVTKARIAAQIKADGTLPLEMDRARSLHYPIYAMRAFMTVATLGDKVGVDLWNYKTSDGRGLRLALDFLTPYLDGSKQWDKNQTVDENESPFAPFLRQAAVKYNDPRYLTAADKLIKGKDTYSIDLTYPSPRLQK